MKGLDRDFAEEVIQRLGRLEDDRKPAWGEMTASDLIPHLIGAFKLSMGQIPEPPFIGNWFTARVLAPMVMAFALSPPRNIKFRNKDGTVRPAMSAPGDISTLGECMEEFIAGVQANTLNSARHPLFGDLGPQGWSKMHVIHLRHHLKQFRL